jgi:hypothetical protein
MRAKFECDRVTRKGNIEEAHLRAVYGGSSNKEDNEFSEATPTGELTISISNEKARGFLKEGTQYYLDFTEARQPAATSTR